MAEIVSPDPGEPFRRDVIYGLGVTTTTNGWAVFSSPITTTRITSLIGDPFAPWHRRVWRRIRQMWRR